MPVLTPEEKKQLQNIASSWYMPPLLERLRRFLEQKNMTVQESAKIAYNHLHEFITQSKEEVEILLEERLVQGEIDSKEQARKAIVGRMLPYLIECVFLKNKEVGNINKNFFITSKQEGVRKFYKDLTIQVGNERQKPDCDLIVYNAKTQKILILSVKTSLRERAGQSYRWKLLLDIANAQNDELRKKYNISYHGSQKLYVGFATTNFYNEINLPQQRGMLKFFDASFIAKPDVSSGFISSMAQFNDFLQENLL